MGQQIEALAQFVATTRWEDIPEPVKRHAKLVVLDLLGVILAGAEQPEVRGLRERLCATAGSGATVLARGWPAADPRTAALLNGIAGRSIELCDTCRFVVGQPGVQALPAILASGEGMPCTGRDMLTALIMAYDVSIRLATVFTGRPLSHPNGQTPMLGAIAAVSRLRGFSAAQASLALRVGATMLLSPSYTNAVAGATTLNVAGGMSGFMGILAPDLALAGFTAQEDGVEQALGHLVGDSFRPEGLLDDLGTVWHITLNHFRVRACCNPIYASLDALEAGLAELKPRPEDIERIEVATYKFASVMRNPDPPNYFAAKYSLPHAAAAIVVRGNAGYGSFTEDIVHDPAIAALRHRVHITEDEAMTAVAPRLKPGRTTIILKDGRRTTHDCESPRGDLQRPYQESELREKFRELAGLALHPAGVAEVEQLVDRFETLPDAQTLMKLLRRHGKP
jgi:2-methylcitrate dehydratase PrpD